MIASCGKTQYSQFFIKTVLNLLEYDPKDRPTAGEVWAMLRPYEAEIKNLRSFVPDKEKSRKSLEAYQEEIRGINQVRTPMTVVTTTTKVMSPVGNIRW